MTAASMLPRKEKARVLPPSMTVKVGLPGDDDSIVTMLRSEMLPDKMKEIFKGTVEYVMEKSSGLVVWPARWIYDCLPPPAIYLAHVEVTVEKAADVLEDFEYRGQTMVLIRNVPDIVPEDALENWFKSGLEDEQPDLVLARNGVGDLEAKLASINNQIDMLPNTAAENAESAKEELESRRRRAEFLKRLKAATEEQLENVRKKMEALQSKSDELRVYKMTKTDRLPPFNEAVWEVKFAETEEGQELSYIATHKSDWHKYWLLWDPAGFRTRAGRSDKPHSEGMTDVPMHLVKVERVRHGQGMYRYNDDRGFYSGQWRHNVFHGIGTQINSVGRYQGHHMMEVKDGKGTLVYARGDVYRGDWGYKTYHYKPSFINGDEYVDGRPHGRGEMEFVDGSVYRGEWADGMPTGKGRYTLPTGDMQEGYFTDWGLLSGEGSTSTDGITMIGNWRRGLLFGFGTEIDVTSGTYDGDFEASLRHGYGTMTYRLVDGTFVGGYSCGDRGGYGLLDFTPYAPGEETGAGAAKAAERDRKKKMGNAATQKAKLLASLPDAGEFRCEGRWRANVVRGGGTMTNRMGQQGNPLAYKFVMASDGNNQHLAEVYRLIQMESVIAKDRSARARTINKSLRDQRKSKERKNMQKFSYWMRQAEKKMVVVEAATKEAREYLKAIAAELDRKKRVADEAAVEINAKNGEEEDDELGLGEQPQSAVRANQPKKEEEGGNKAEGEDGDDEDGDGGGGGGGGGTHTDAGGGGDGAGSRPGTSGTGLTGTTTTNTNTMTTATRPGTATVA